MPQTNRSAATRQAAIDVTIAAHQIHAHLISVVIKVPQPAARQVVRLPVWIPGSYMVREFAQHLQSLRAEQGGEALPVKALDKTSWRISSRAGEPLVLRYEVYAFDPSVRMAYVDDERCFFNGTGVVLQIAGAEHLPHTVLMPRPQHPAAAAWQMVTGMEAVRVDADGFGRYRCADYDELADCPVTQGRMWRRDFTVRGIPHVWAITGAPANLDGARLVADTQRIIETEFDQWHGQGGTPPWERYVFMMHAADNAYGGLEHRNSTALVCARKDLPKSDANGPQPPKPLQASQPYVQLLGLISHEYFHTWNVKRLRPDAFARYDYSRENYTELLWFFEGFTSYYDDLVLCRAGLIDVDTYLQLLAKTWNQVLQTPGESLQSVAQSSFDAWTRYYRITENTPNATVSYYTKGALVALCLDAALRGAGRDLDQLMRALWQHTRGGPMRQADIAAVLNSWGLASVARTLDAWVHRTDALPVEQALQSLGVKVAWGDASLAQRLGLRVREDHTGLHITHVLRGGAGEAMGLCAGDEWLSVQVGRQHARVRKLQDVQQWLNATGRFKAWVARDGRMRQLDGQWPVQGASRGSAKTGATTQVAKLSISANHKA